MSETDLSPGTCGAHPYHRGSEDKRKEEVHRKTQQKRKTTRGHQAGRTNNNKLNHLQNRTLRSTSKPLEHGDLIIESRDLVRIVGLSIILGSYIWLE